MIIRTIENNTLSWPSPLLLVVCMAGGIAIGLIVHFTFYPIGKWLSSHEHLTEHHEIANHFIGVVGVIYAVLVGFIVVTAWQAHHRAQDLTMQEQRDVKDLFQLSGAYPANRETESVRKMLHDYAHEMSVEWRQMAKGVVICGDCASSGRDCGANTSAQPADQLNHCIRERTFGLKPVTPQEEVIYREGIDLTRSFSESREQIRYRYKQRTLQSIIWWSFLLGALILAFMTYLVPGQNRRSQLFRTAAFFGVIGMMVALALVFDHPFVGKVQVDGSQWGRMETTFASALARDKRLKSDPLGMCP